jgi:hypothetical protein
MSKNRAFILALIGALTAPVWADQPVNTAGVSVKLYGYTKLDASYDTQRTSAGDYAFYLLPLAAKKSDNDLNITARETRVGLAFSGPDTDNLKTTGKFEIDFYSNGGTENAATPRLRLAYVDIAGPHGLSLRAGQDWDAFVTVNPNTLDAAFLGDAGNLYQRRGQLRLTEATDLGSAKLTFRAAGARTVGQDIDGGGADDGSDSGRPTLEGAAIVDVPLLTKKPARFSVSGELGWETLDASSGTTIVSPDVKTLKSRVLIGGIVFPITETVSFAGTYWKGSNLDAFYGGIGQGINKTLTRSVTASGGWGQVQADLTPTVNVNAGYGVDNPDDKDLNTGDRAVNTRKFASAYYKATSAVTFAFEYSRLHTEYKKQGPVNGDRFQGSVIYKF